MMNITAYTIEIKEDGIWVFYKRTYSKHTAEAIMKAFGNLARLSVFKM